MDKILYKSWMRQSLIYLLALGLTVLCVAPLFWMALTSIKPDEEILASPPKLWTNEGSLDAYSRLFAHTNFLEYLQNSIFVAGRCCAFLSRHWPVTASRAFVSGEGRRLLPRHCLPI